MHPRLCVSAVSSYGWTLDQDLTFWEDAGIDRVGLSLRKVDDAGFDRAVARVRDAGLTEKSGTTVTEADTATHGPPVLAWFRTPTKR